ncbi:MAG: hypothetical protein COU68_04145 [Candidatus Pacebacteria bacterium CG10_big_fil_rev_8_21_14_0_10_45_6]|nr:MAG: hypothetical protein COU68_04145 [Candidatus Pacebacteria bacterium CG10_big_fil_rev_8_21_14_0_10_45_6]
MNTRKTFAGFNLDDVFKQEEERLRNEREEAENRKRKNVLEEKLRAKKGPVPATEPASPPAQTSTPKTKKTKNTPATTGIAYAGIIFEPTAHYDGDDKKLLTYNQSLTRLQKAGYETHARPQEAFGLIIDGLEGKLTGQLSQLKDVQKDMLNSYGEWLSLAIERKGDILVAYLDPEGLAWKKDHYAKTSKFKSSSQKELDIAGKNSEEWINLKEFDDEFTKYFYAREFASLPKEIQNKTQVYLPADRTVWPVGCDKFYIVDYVSNGASRGVRRAKKSP